MKEGRLIVFATTHQTMQAESVLKEGGLSGVLVLKPKGLVGNCGLALQVGLTEIDRAVQLLGKRHIVPAGVFQSGPGDHWEKALP